MFDELQAKIEQLVWGSVLQSKGVPGRIAAKVLHYLYALVRDILAGQLTLRAMSLVYTTLLSVVPLIAMSFSVLKGLGVHNDLKPLLYQGLAPLGEQGREITDEVINLVDNVRGGLLGSVSLAFFVFTAISMVQKVEESFNFVWHVGQPRSIARRFSEYLVVLLVGPVVVVIALGMIASVRNNDIVQMLLAHEALGTVFVAAGKVTPYLLVAGVFTFLYMFVPNTKVSFKSALIGGAVGGCMWAAIGVIFTTFVVYAGTRQLIYSGFAVVITTLIWLYLSWLVLLIGAQLAFYHQRPAFLRIGRREPSLSNSMRECLALNTMYLVGQAFRDKDKKITLDKICTQLKVPSIALVPIANRLENGGLLLVTEKEELLPGREVSRIQIAEILDVVRQQGDTGSYRGPSWTPDVESIGEQLEKAVGDVAGNQTLSDLLDRAEKD
ncbi:MAG TPA: YihY/virulence factor BrkB family protein [Woeseiaceae bacterium]|nr:YihY/virulence factor BrkB family protein [Woeseiaceae bacterium]